MRDVFVYSQTDMSATRLLGMIDPIVPTSGPKHQAWSWLVEYIQERASQHTGRCFECRQTRVLSKYVTKLCHSLNDSWWKVLSTHKVLQ